MTHDRYALIAQVAPIFLLVIAAERRQFAGQIDRLAAKVQQFMLTAGAVLLAYASVIGLIYATTTDPAPRWIDGTLVGLTGLGVGAAIGPLLTLIWLDTAAPRSIQPNKGPEADKPEESDD